jgi:DNA-binding FadR family transcriptional regulator
MTMDSSRNQVRIPKTAEIVAGHIRKAIVRGELKPGSNLPGEAQLITQFEVSRPTLREAIRILESENLIRISRGARKGATILGPSPEIVARSMGLALQMQGATIGDVYEARTLIEPPAARLAALANSGDAAAALSECIHAELAAIDLQDSARFQTASSHFHYTLMSHCGNATMAVIAYALDELVNKHQSLVYEKQFQGDVAQRWRQIRYGVRSHQRLIDLVTAGDGAGAEAHWYRHMVNAGKFWLDEVAEKALIDVV